MGYRDDGEARALRRAWLDAEIARLELEVLLYAERLATLEALHAERDGWPPVTARVAPRSGVGWEALAVALLVGLPTAALALVLFVLVPVPARGCHSHRSQTRMDAQGVRSAALLYLGQEPGAACPTIADLERAGTIDRSRRTTDAWGTPFRIACDGDDIRVLSAGPDRVFGTDDLDGRATRP